MHNLTYGGVLMRQTELLLSEDDREAADARSSKGLHHSREVSRARMLACLDAGIPEAQILAATGSRANRLVANPRDVTTMGSGVGGVRCGQT